MAKYLILIVFLSQLIGLNKAFSFSDGILVGNGGGVVESQMFHEWQNIAGTLEQFKLSTSGLSDEDKRVLELLSETRAVHLEESLLFLEKSQFDDLVSDTRSYLFKTERTPGAIIYINSNALYGDAPGEHLTYQDVLLSLLEVLAFQSNLDIGGVLQEVQIWYSAEFKDYYLHQSQDLLGAVRISSLIRSEVLISDNLHVINASSILINEAVCPEGGPDGLALLDISRGGVDSIEGSVIFQISANVKYTCTEGDQQLDISGKVNFKLKYILNEDAEFVFENLKQPISDILYHSLEIR